MESGLLQFSTLHELSSRAAEQWPTKPLFGTHAPLGFDWMTYADFYSKVNNTRAVLADMGVKKGDTVGVIANNRWEWASIACASHNLSAVVVPMYEVRRVRGA